MNPRLPAVLTLDEFAFLTRRPVRTLRSHIRSGKLKAQGWPALAPCRELLKYGVTLEDAGILLHERGAQAPNTAPEAATISN